MLERGERGGGLHTTVYLRAVYQGFIIFAANGGIGDRDLAIE
jgi:hypothetical protein